LSSATIAPASTRTIFRTEGATDVLPAVLREIRRPLQAAYETKPLRHLEVRSLGSAGLAHRGRFHCELLI